MTSDHRVAGLSPAGCRLLAIKLLKHNRHLENDDTEMSILATS